MKRAHPQKYRRRESGTGKQGSMICHLRRFRVKGGDPSRKYQMATGSAKNLAVMHDLMKSRCRGGKGASCASILAPVRLFMPQRWPQFPRRKLMVAKGVN
jgi:hypothetical protein